MTWSLSMKQRRNFITAIYRSVHWLHYLSLQRTVESRFLVASRDWKKSGSINRGVRETGGKITVFNRVKGNDFCLELLRGLTNRGFEESGFYCTYNCISIIMTDSRLLRKPPWETKTALINREFEISRVKLQLLTKWSKFKGNGIWFEFIPGGFRNCENWAFTVSTNGMDLMLE